MSETPATNGDPISAEPPSTDAEVTREAILRVNEARDLGDAEHINRFTFYDHTKIYTAAPPDVLRVDESICENTTFSTS